MADARARYTARPMGAPESIYWAEDGGVLEQIVTALGERFALDRERLTRGTVYYDTFDWRLWRRGERLEVDLAAEGVPARWIASNGSSRRALLGHEPGLAADLLPGDFGDALAAVIEMRRLLPLAEVRYDGHLIRVLDRRRKTVVRLTAETRRVRRPGSKGRLEALRPRLRLTPVKGYPKDAREVSAWLDGSDALERGRSNDFEEAVAAIGREAGDYGKKVVVQLDPNLEADSATRLVLRSLLATALANERGVIDDVDSEFLHDFRVSVRRTRSALAQIKGVFGADRIASLRSELSWLGKVTGPTRDLDVYQLKLPAYADQLPPEVRGDLAPLAERLRELHRKEQGTLAEALSSARYRRLKRSWARFLEREPEEGERTVLGLEPVLRVATSCIARAHRKVLRKGRAITDDSPARALHRLRLDCKKLRYLMEIFRSLFPAGEVERSIRALKEFQDNLGDFQDYGVQQSMLCHLAAGLETAAGGAGTLMAIGRLVARLEAGERRERSRFAKSFAHFSSKKTARRFRAMLDGGGGVP